MLSINLEPIRVEDPCPELLAWMSDAIVSEAMHRCVTSPYVVVFGSHHARKFQTLKDQVHSWRPQAIISRCDQPTGGGSRML